MYTKKSTTFPEHMENVSEELPTTDTDVTNDTLEENICASSKVEEVAFGAATSKGTISGQLQSIETEQELKRSDNPWKPRSMNKNEFSNEDFETDYVLQQVRSILNKLTAQNFQSLVEKLETLEINTEAITEPLYSKAYANLCRTQSQFQIATTSSSNPGSTLEFRKTLVTRCQREFEKDRANDEALKMLREKLANASAQEKGGIKKELWLAEMKEKKRMLGNIRFIGELFKLSMLTRSVIHLCVMALCRRKDEDSLECLVVLIKTAGKYVDHKGKQRMDQYFQHIRKIINEKKTSNRNDWVPSQKTLPHPQILERMHIKAKLEQCQNASTSIKTFIQSKYENIIEEYINTPHIKKAEKSLKQLKTKTTQHTFVEVAMQMSMEHSEISRKSVSNLLVYLLTNNTISVDEYCKGIISVVTEAIDLELDTPKIWQYLAELIAPVLNAESTGISMLYISQLSYPLHGEGKTKNFVEEILKQLMLCTNGSDITKAWSTYQNHWILLGMTNKEPQKLTKPKATTSIKT